MYYIGEKIKKLRRKNDLTQEKLADQLGVSYQTVSKWETGVTSPDLSLIVPLARLFKVTTDELFGFDEDADMLRKKELDSEYWETWKSGDLHKRFEVSKQAVKEFPDDMEWHERLAWTQAMNSFEYKDDTQYVQEQEEAIRRFALVIENASDERIKASAIFGIVQYLGFRGRRDEAERYAELYPENLPYRKEYVLLQCLEGDKKAVHHQKMLENAMFDLINLIGEGSDTACDAQEQILKTMMPDGNYLYCHCILGQIYRRRADFRMKEGDCDKAAEMIKQAFYHATEYDRSMKGNTSPKSEPFFDKLQWNVDEICKTGTRTDIEEMLEFLKKPLYDKLRERDDIKALTENYARQ
ncbi:MAG: helix-turn-helix transcriptional regulator [Ruminococcaceae bacterium]|nr:helix-turn-helix transcriptional regulator [Oscillospiraceae bacterium]